jgi:hypothetical protein
MRAAVDEHFGYAQTCHMNTGQAASEQHLSRDLLLVFGRLIAGLIIIADIGLTMSWLPAASSSLFNRESPEINWLSMRVWFSLWLGLGLVAWLLVGALDVISPAGDELRKRDQDADERHQYLVRFRLCERLAIVGTVSVICGAVLGYWDPGPVSGAFVPLGLALLWAAQSLYCRTRARDEPSADRGGSYG